jgi:small metal-binding protein
MSRMMQAAGLATIVALFAGRVASAQEPQRPMESAAPAMQDADHLTEAVKQTQAAIDAGNSGQTNLVVEHAEQALTHAQAAEQERPSPKLEAAIKSLKQAVKEGKSGKVEVAMKAARTALQQLQA